MNFYHSFYIDVPAQDCQELYDFGFRETGLYAVQPNDNGGEFVVYCDMSLLGGGWTVIQRRVDGNLDFDRNYACYRSGFGDFWKNFWLGLEKISRLTRSCSTVNTSMELYIGLEAFFPQSVFARYTNITVLGEEDGYMLKISGYNRSSSAHDSLNIHNNQRFTTKDMDQDEHLQNCASLFKGGWWYKNCHDSNLNGVYYENGLLRDSKVPDGIIWDSWLGDAYSLKSTVMAIRPYKGH